MSKRRYYHPQTDLYNRLKIPVPDATTHGTESDIQEKMVKLQPTKWRMQGNKLIGETEMGVLVNFLPSDVILKGTDENGLPVLKHIDK